MIAPRFINLRGTSGSGKSTLTVKVLREPGLYLPPEPYYIPGRRQPLYYVRQPIDARALRPLAIIGHYEIACGGADTIRTPDQAAKLSRELIEAGLDVVVEGVVLSTLARFVVDMHQEGIDVRIFYLTTSLADCVAGINSRRTTRGAALMTVAQAATGPTGKRLRTLTKQAEDLAHMSINVSKGTRTEAADWLRGLGVLS